MRSRLIKALNNRFYVKFMQLEIGLFSISKMTYIHLAHSSPAPIRPDLFSRSPGREGGRSEAQIQKIKVNTGVDLEIKRGVSIFPKLSLSWESGGAVSPPVGPGQSLGGGPGGEAPGSSPDFEFFLP